MKHKALIDRLVTFGLALVLVVAVTVAYQVGARSGVSSASGEALAAGTAARAGTGYISVPAAAFVPEHYLVNYTNDGNTLALAVGYTGGASFFAPLHLPHGATLTKLTLSYYDNDADLDDDVTLSLHRGEGTTKAYQVHVSSNTDGVGSKSVDYTLDIDNSEYTYFLQLYLADTYPGLEFYKAIIEFTYPTTFVPLMLRDF